MYVSNLMAELFYFTLLVGGVFGLICFILVMTVKGIAAAIGYDIVQLSNWFTKWANN